MVFVETAAITYIGRKRSVNEDSFLVDDRLGLYIVADGVGGHKAGDVASNLVVKSIQQSMTRFIEGKDREEPTDDDGSFSSEAGLLLSCLQYANREVNRISRADKSCHGMCSTVSAVYITDEGLVAANVGDSPIWLVHRREIETLSVSHTVEAAQLMLDRGVKGSTKSGLRHMLTRAIGVEETVKVDICQAHCFEGDVLIMASDGLSNKVCPEEVLEVVSRWSPDAACRILVNIADERGGEDNVTVIVSRVKMIERRRHGFMGLVSRVVKSCSFC